MTNERPRLPDDEEKWDLIELQQKIHDDIIREEEREKFRATALADHDSKRSSINEAFVYLEEDEGLTWRQIIERALSRFGESFLHARHTFTEAQLSSLYKDGCFDAGLSGFTVWTGTRVYFPAKYDGCHWVDSVSAVPDGYPKEPVGC